VVLLAAFVGGCDGGSEATPPTTTLSPDEEPWILVRDVVNARDVGSGAGDAAHVAEGVLYRGAPLQGLSSAGCDEFARRGIRTVIDLRIDSERGSLLAADCVTARARVVLAPLPVPYDVSAADYIAILDAGDSIAEAFRVLGDGGSYPVYVNCTWGRDRTGVLVAVALLALGVSADVIMDEYLLSRATVGATPSSLQAALDELERRGGIDAYLASVGVTDAQIAALRARALAPID
jgi:protein-tyrosine phosphatase